MKLKVIKHKFYLIYQYIMLIYLLFILKKYGKNNKK